MIALVGCCKMKLDRAAPARELYTSPLFKLSLAYALQHSETAYIASALYGLVELDEVLEPYDTTVGDQPDDVVEGWARDIAREVFNRHGAGSLLLLAGSTYAKPIGGAYRALCNGTGIVVEPLRGKQIGERLSFLARTQRAARRAA